MLFRQPQAGHDLALLQALGFMGQAVQALEQGTPFAEGPALHQGDAALHHLAPVDLLQQGEQGVAGHQLILAHVEPGVQAGEGAVQARAPAAQARFARVAQQAVAAHAREQATERRAPWYVHHRLVLQRQRFVQIAAHPETGDRNADHDEQHQ